MPFQRAGAIESGMSEIEERLAEIERLGLGRQLRIVAGPQGPHVALDGEL